MTFYFIWVIRKNMIYFISLFIVLLDQLSKGMILDYFSSGKVLEVFPCFNLLLTYNKGVSFSFLSSDSPYMPLILSAFALIVCIFIVMWMRQEKDRLTRIGFALVLGGAVGNVIDRIRLGAVVDFLDFYIGNYHWPTFNVADCAICIGVFLILVRTFIIKKELGEKK